MRLFLCRHEVPGSSSTLRSSKRSHVGFSRATSLSHREVIPPSPSLSSLRNRNNVVLATSREWGADSERPPGYTARGRNTLPRVAGEDGQMRYCLMVSMPKHVQDFLPGKMGWVATASKDGEPNATPKGTVRVLDSEHSVFADLYS